MTCPIKIARLPNDDRPITLTDFLIALVLTSIECHWLGQGVDLRKMTFYIASVIAVLIERPSDHSPRDYKDTQLRQ